MNTHLNSAPIEVLEATLCEDCKHPDMNMAEYACQSFLQDNQAVCTDCCKCFAHHGNGECECCIVFTAPDDITDEDN